MKKKREKEKIPEMKKKRFFSPFFAKKAGKTAQNSILFRIFSADKKVEDEKLYFCYFWRNLIMKKKSFLKKLQKKSFFLLFSEEINNEDRPEKVFYETGCRGVRRECE